MADSVETISALSGVATDSGAAHSRRLKRADPRPAARILTLHTTIIPGLALLAGFIMGYSAGASFLLRPATDARLFPAFGLFFLGLPLGGAVLPGLLAWAHRATNPLGAGIRKAVAGIIVAGALLALLPGFDAYVFNRPLRAVANFFLGLAVATVLRLFFARFPKQHRGIWFGLAWGAGVFSWNLLTYLPGSVTFGPGMAYHPFLKWVYVVHTAAAW